jgi:hypothetical protein
MLWDIDEKFMINIYSKQILGKVCRSRTPLFTSIKNAEQALGENHHTTVKIRKNLQMMRQQQHPSS